MLLFLNVGGGEFVLIIFVILLFFGSKNLPELARGLGRGIREFKDAMNGIQHEIQREVNEVKKDIDNPDQTNS